MGDKTLATYAGKKKILSIVPSLDTPVCATSTKLFNEKAGALDGVVVLTISVEITDEPLKGVTARAVLVVDESDTVIHSELVPEIAQEPNYEAALNKVS